ncbi:MAG: murD [Bacillales bacterium]|nr:murD [Bacillales bacterium]
MKNVNIYRNKNVLVLGIAKSGFSVSKLLFKLGANVTVNDYQVVNEGCLGHELQQMGIEVIGGGHPLSILDSNFDFIVKNPGIPYTNEILIEAEKRKIPIITEIEVAYQLCEAPFIGISGSNGKTTTTTLLFEMLKEGGKKPIIAGNIGEVACEVIQSATKDNIIVTELSSFQLLGISEFKPKYALLLNIFDAHLDYHKTKENYIEAKMQMFKNQDSSDYAILNIDDATINSLKDKIKSEIVPFSLHNPNRNSVYVDDSALFYKNEKIIDLPDIVLPGAHNLENILAATSVAKLCDVSNEAIRTILSSFSGVQHRLQYVGTINSRKFYNDSKATNILATSKAIGAFDEKVILIAGGLDRGNNFDNLVSDLKNVKAIVCYGETKEKLKEAAQKAKVDIIEVSYNLMDAVKIAYSNSNSNDVILFSPACASWDQFANFEQRGDMFVEEVNKLEV